MIPKSITICPVTEENQQQVLALKPAHGQEDFIETTAQCLQEAKEYHVWRPVAIYASDLLAGFAMYGYFRKENNRVWLDRLMIDGQFQGHGYGSIALDQLVKRLGEEYHCDKIFLSVYKENTKAQEMYQRHGFRKTGEYDFNGEEIMMLTLPQ